MQYERQQYLNQLIRRKDNGRIKIITGLRRSGKSFLLFSLYRQYLLKSGVLENQIIGISLDELENARYRNPFELNRLIRTGDIIFSSMKYSSWLKFRIHMWTILT